MKPSFDFFLNGVFFSFLSLPKMAAPTPLHSASFSYLSCRAVRVLQDCCSTYSQSCSFRGRISRDQISFSMLHFPCLPFFLLPLPLFARSNKLLVWSELSEPVPPLVLEDSASDLLLEAPLAFFFLFVFLLFSLRYRSLPEESDGDLLALLLRFCALAPLGRLSAAFAGIYPSTAMESSLLLAAVVRLRRPPVAPAASLGELAWLLGPTKFKFKPDFVPIMCPRHALSSYITIS